MADWEWRNDSESEEKKKEKSGYVTRKEFYICFVVLLAVIFWQGISTKDHVWQAKNNLRSEMQSAESRINHQIESIPRNIEQGIEDANNPLRESDLKITDVDMKAQTATLCMTALPKEYTDSMEVQFFLSCDGAEAEAIPAATGADRVFKAEATIPFCDMVSATVNLKKGDTETICALGEMSIQEQVLPSFSGHWSGSRQWTAGQKFITFKGSLIVDVAKPAWVMSQNKGKDWTFRNPAAEVYIGGKLVKTLPTQLILEDEYMYSYESYDAMLAEGEEALKLYEGETIEFVFRLEDSNGLKYRYVVEKGNYIKDGEYQEEAPADSMNPVSGGRLTIE